MIRGALWPQAYPQILYSASGMHGNGSEDHDWVWNGFAWWHKAGQCVNCILEWKIKCYLKPTAHVACDNIPSGFERLDRGQGHLHCTFKSAGSQFLQHYEPEVLCRFKHFSSQAAAHNYLKHFICLFVFVHEIIESMNHQVWKARKYRKMSFKGSKNWRWCL